MADQEYSIPVIDISALGAVDGEPDDAAIAAQVRQACLNAGFFYLSGHGIDADLLSDVFAANRVFHDRPIAEKMKIRLNQWHRGYQALATSTLVSSARFEPATIANQLESYILRHEVSPNDPDYEERGLKGPNQWPAQRPDDPNFRDAVSRYDAVIRELGLRLLPVFSLAVGEKADFFQTFFDPPSTALRLIHYPPASPTRTDDEYGIHPHTDYGFITILAQDDIGGLEIQTPDGGWISAPVIEGTLIVNIGDNLARWTNDVFNSTPHRVINNSTSRDRYSIAMFFDPNVEAIIRCLDQFVDEYHPAKYTPVSYGDYYQNRLDTNYPDRSDAANRSS